MHRSLYIVLALASSLVAAAPPARAQDANLGRNVAEQFFAIERARQVKRGQDRHWTSGRTAKKASTVVVDEVELTRMLAKMAR